MTRTQDAPSPDAQLGIPDQVFRSTMSRFCTGVVAISALVNDEPVGMTCQSFLSLSLDPQLVAFAPGCASTTYPVLRQADRFSIAVLSEDQAELALALSRRGTDKFAGVSWQVSESGVPAIDGCLAWMECSRETEHDAGDHLLVVARVHALGYLEEGEPLTYFKSSFNAIGSR